MGVKLAGRVGFIVDGDAPFKSIRVSPMPTSPFGGWRLGLRTGVLPFALAAGAEVFQLRNTASTPIVIRRLGVGFVTTTAFSAAGEISFGATIARSWSAAGTGGTAVSLASNNAKKRTTFNSPSGMEIRYATTAALGAGTKTLDTDDVSVVAGWSGGQGTTLPAAIDNLWDTTSEDYPIVLAQNEGIVVRNKVLFPPTSGGGVATINVGFDEYAAGEFGS
jgi:hypothetical protein